MKSIQPKARPNHPIPDATALRAATHYAENENGCWISAYALNKTTGYSAVSWRVDDTQRTIGAHRAAWTHHNGPIPDGMTVDHTCWNRQCVNPTHLRLLSNRDNAARRGGRDFPIGQCGNGHDASLRQVAKWGSVPAQTYCPLCLKEKNDRTTALRRLERVYGLVLTKRQEDMVDEFMPHYARRTDAA